MDRSLGWIKVHREIRAHWIWDDPVKLKWWLDILLEVNHSGKKVSIGYKVFDCERGQCVISLKNWGKRWKVSKSVVKNFFRMLESDGMIRNANETVTTRLTVCNYDSYQQNENANDTHSIRIENASRTQQSTTKNVKKEKKEKKEVKEVHKLVLFIETNYPKVSKLDSPTSEQCEKLKELYSEHLIIDVLDAMENFKELNKKYTSCYLTVNNWCKKRMESGNIAPPKKTKTEFVKFFHND
jgi:hypothetical protein